MTMKVFKYEYATVDGETGSFTVHEHDESIANTEAKLTVARRVNPASLTRFDLVCQGPAS